MEATPNHVFSHPAQLEEGSYGTQTTRAKNAALAPRSAVQLKLPMPCQCAHQTRPVPCGRYERTASATQPPPPQREAGAKWRKRRIAPVAGHQPVLHGTKLAPVGLNPRGGLHPRAWTGRHPDGDLTPRQAASQTDRLVGCGRGVKGMASATDGRLSDDPQQQH